MKNYTIDCNYYTKSFDNMDELINDITISGMDPNYEILLNGKKTGEQIIDLLIF
tara:strand:- start:215 stop:376 length:162 start_codon:yes stop_codon:yes gene_type:complete